jgi:coatomer subunit beta
MDPSATCYTIVHDDLADSPTSQDLRAALQKGSDEVKLETMRRIIVGTLNGQGHVSSLPRFFAVDRHRVEGTRASCVFVR